MIITRLAGRKKLFLLQSFLSIINITLSALILTTAHYMISGIFLIFIFPCIVSLIYIDRKPVYFAFIVSLLAYILVSVFFLYSKAATGEIIYGVMESITAIAFICVGMALALYILNLKKVLVESILDEKQKNKTDSLTRLLNHAAFYEQLDESIMEIIEKQEDAEPLSIIIWDLDNFKQVNDLYGHSIGDQVILAFVSAIKKVTDNRYQAYRYGGEEFALIIRKNAQETFTIAEDVRKEFEICSKLDCFPIGSTVSGGICEYNHKTLTGKREFFAAADEALYNAKKTGKNKSVVHNERLLHN
jgi:diguanylate cyclase (GGDEF)-like protein